MDPNHTKSESVHKRPSKNFFQFSLQKLFALVLVCCLAFTWWSYYRTIQLEKEAIQWFEQKGHVCLRGIDKTLLKPVLLG